MFRRCVVGLEFGSSIGFIMLLVLFGWFTNGSFVEHGFRGGGHGFGGFDGLGVPLSHVKPTATLPYFP